MTARNDQRLSQYPVRKVARLTIGFPQNLKRKYFVLIALLRLGEFGKPDSSEGAYPDHHLALVHGHMRGGDKTLSAVCRTCTNRLHKFEILLSQIF